MAAWWLAPFARTTIKRSRCSYRRASRQRSCRATRSNRFSNRGGRCLWAPCRSKRASGSRGSWKSAGLSRGAQRQASQARGGDRGSGRAQGRRDDCHEHGRRGTDIILGGNAETMAWALLQDKYATRLDVPADEWDRLVSEIEQREGMKAEGQHVKDIGGLHIVGTGAPRSPPDRLAVARPLRSTGDPGSSRFYLSLEDDLMRIFAGEWSRMCSRGSACRKARRSRARWSHGGSKGAKESRRAQLRSPQESARIR